MEEAIFDGGCWLPPKFVGNADLGVCLAPLGSDGWCAFAHGIHGVECASEVWAAWRALFLPDSKGAGDDAGLGYLQSLLHY